jgi:hypothetical protein
MMFETLITFPQRLGVGSRTYVYVALWCTRRLESCACAWQTTSLSAYSVRDNVFFWEVIDVLQTC